MINDIKHHMRNGSMITKLLIVNVGLFVLQSLIFLFFTLSGKGIVFESWLEWLYVPKGFMNSSGVNDLVHKPWSLFTYQFLHEPLSIFHILFNMLYLYFFGNILVNFLNRKYILPLYLTGGITGALLFMVTYNLSPVFQTHDAVLVGASASILALVVAAAALAPDYTVFLILIGPVRLKYIALVAVLIDIVSISAGDNAGGHIAHIGGALTGYFYILSYKNGNNWFGWWPRFETWITGLFKRQKPKVVFVNEKQQAPAQKKPGRSEQNQKHMDEILDKIAQSGYNSLTKAEKEFLFKISNEKE